MLIYNVFLKIFCIFPDFVQKIRKIIFKAIVYVFKGFHFILYKCFYFYYRNLLIYAKVEIVL